MRYICFLISCTLWLAGPVGAQQVTIHIVDGRNGSPLVNAQIHLAALQHYALGPLTSKVQPSGTAYVVTLPPDAIEIMLDSVSLGGKNYRTCTKLQKGDLSAATKILATGITLKNDCNTGVMARSVPGEITFFVRPFTASEILSNWWAGAFNG